MVIKTDSCYFSEFKIFPGHGKKFIRKDGKLLSFVSNKAASLYHQHKKASKLCWTLQWRRFNKKGKVETIAKRKVKRAVRGLAKGVGGMQLDDLLKKKAQKPEFRQAARDAALREIKDRKKKAAGKAAPAKGSKAAAAAPKKAGAFVKAAPKSVRVSKR